MRRSPGGIVSLLLRVEQAGFHRFGGRHTLEHCIQRMHRCIVCEGGDKHGWLSDTYLPEASAPEHQRCKPSGPNECRCPLCIERTTCKGAHACIYRLVGADRTSSAPDAACGSTRAPQGHSATWIAIEWLVCTSYSVPSGSHLRFTALSQNWHLEGAPVIRSGQWQAEQLRSAGLLRAE
jgi:hypothetical protein